MSKETVIDKLTPAQEAEIPRYLEKYTKVILSTEPCDRAEGEKAILECYKLLGYTKYVPKIYWEDSPFAAQVKATKLLHNREDVTQEEIKQMANHACFGSMEAHWVAFYAFISEVVLNKPDALVEACKGVSNNSGAYFANEQWVVMSEKPTAIHLKDNCLHREDGPAIEYKDGTGVFAIHGKRVRSLISRELDGK